MRGEHGTATERQAGRVVVALAACGVLAAGLALLCGWRLALLAAVRGGDTGAARALADVDGAVRGAWTVFSLLFVVTGVLWVRWFTALHRPVEALGAARFASGWGLWGWLIPVFNLFRPKQLVNDVWRVGDPPDGRATPPGVVQAWWALWVVMTVFSARPDRARSWRPGTDAGPLLADGAYDLAYLVLVAVTAVLAIATVRRLTERLAAFHEMAQPTLASVLSRRPR